MESLIAQLIHSVLWILLILALAGCTLSGGSPPSANNKNAVTITFAVISGNNSPYQTAIDAFEAQNPGLQVLLLPLEATQSDLATLAGQADTILWNGAFSDPSSAYFLDLDPLLASAAIDPHAYWPGALQGCQVGGVQKGLPISLDPRLFYYNRAAFDQAGLAYPQPGWTWADLRSAVQALADPTADPPRYGLLDPNPGSSLNGPVTALLAAGQDAAGLADGLQWYLDLARSGDLGIAGVNTQGDFTTLVANGQAALWPGLFSSSSSIGQPANTSTGVVPYPTDAATPAGNPVNPGCAVISAGSAQPAASWAWLQYLSQNPVTPFGVPAHRAAADQTKIRDTLAPETATALRYALEHAWYDWIHNDYSTVDQAIQTAIETGEDLAGLLPADISAASLAATLPTANATVVAISPPKVTVTPVNTASEGALSAVFFANPEIVTNTQDVQTLADEFNSNHPEMHIQIVTERVGYEGGLSDVFDATHFDCISAGSNLSAAVFSSTDDTDFVDKIISLDPLLDSTSQSWLDEIDPTLLDGSRLNGILYGMPVTISPLVVYYNSALLQKLGLTAPNPDWTATDFWSLASTVASKGEGTYGYVPDSTLPFSFLSPAPFLDLSQTWPEAQYDRPELVSLLNQLGQYARDHTIFPTDNGGTRSPLGNYMARDDAIRLGKGALWAGVIGQRMGMQEPFDSASGYSSSDIGVAVWPTQQTISGGISLYITKQAKNPQVCWQWFEFLQEQPVSAFQGIPVRPSVINSAAWSASVGEEMAAVIKATLPNLEYAGRDNLYPPQPFVQWWQDALAAVEQDGQDATVSLQVVQYKAQAALDCMQAAGVSPSLPSEKQYDTAVACAHQVDPDYHSPDELWALQASQQ
jgi:ABC-type glycerol-3-phosphate transport system substrate-binding protein